MLPIVKVGHTQLRKEKYRQNQIDHGKDHVVDYSFNLVGRIVPGALDSTGHIAGAGGKGRGAEQTNCQQENQKHTEELFVLEHKKPPFF